MTRPSLKDAQSAIERMLANGVDWFELGTSWFMESSSSDDISPVYDEAMLDTNLESRILPTLRDERLEEIIRLFHENGIKLFLRPGIEINVPNSWRGTIHPASWDAWFNSYVQFVTHYARVASRTEVELLSIGFELNSSVRHTESWNSVIGEVRKAYSGPISYDCGGLLYHGTESEYSTEKLGSAWEPVSIGDFLADVDYIGIDWYPRLTNNPNATVKEMAANAQRLADAFLRPVAERYNEPIFFAEIDYSSVDRTAINPLYYRSGGGADELEQANAFEAIFQTFQDESWFAGMFPTGFYLTVFRDQIGTTNSLWYKQAEETFRRWYVGN
jgi:hypothetical protein